MPPNRHAQRTCQAPVLLPARKLGRKASSMARTWHATTAHVRHRKGEAEQVAHIAGVIVVRRVHRLHDGEVGALRPANGRRPPEAVRGCILRAVPRKPTRRYLAGLAGLRHGSCRQGAPFERWRQQARRMLMEACDRLAPLTAARPSKLPSSKLPEVRRVASRVAARCGHIRQRPVLAASHQRPLDAEQALATMHAA